MQKILVIEDEEPVRDNILELLTAEGFKVVSAKNGSSGVKLAQQQQPDLILCDIMMPELDGYGVLDSLRQDPATATIPFIFLTAKTDKTDLRQGMELGADDYLTKPFTADELLNAIATRLEKQAAIAKQYLAEQQRADGLKRKTEELQRTLDLKEDILKRLSQELRDPLSNINMAIRMLQQSTTDSQRQRYLEILQDECSREIALLNEIADLQDFLTPDNIKLLRRFNLLKQRTGQKTSDP